MGSCEVFLIMSEPLGLLNESIVELVSVVLSSFAGFVFFVYKLIKHNKISCNTKSEIFNSIETIKREVTTNGGKSLKDTINCLKDTCERIEKSQKITEQRSKASLHYIDQALFEIDKTGKLVWTNEKFFDLTGETFTDMEGYDWLTYVHESERDRFFHELESCIKMNRKLQVDTINNKKEPIKLVGYPYKLNDKENDGFLVNISM